MFDLSESGILVIRTTPRPGKVCFKAERRISVNRAMRWPSIYKSSQNLRSGAIMLVPFCRTSSPDYILPESTNMEEWKKEVLQEKRESAQVTIADIESYCTTLELVDV